MGAVRNLGYTTFFKRRYSPAAIFLSLCTNVGDVQAMQRGSFYLLFRKLSKINFPKLESLYIHPPINHRKEDNILNDKTLKELVLNIPNLSFIQFGDSFFKSNLTFKTLMELFENRSIFMIFSEIHSQVLMEKWFLNHDKDLYEKYQNLKFKFYWRLEK